MLRVLARGGSEVACEDPGALWYDLESPTNEEEADVEADLGIDVPTPDERAAFEESARYYEEGEALHGRIHGFNVSVAHVWAEQERLLDKVGQRMPVEDGYIAATARRYGLTIATGNDRDFRRPGLKVFNPFKELP